MTCLEWGTGLTADLDVTSDHDGTGWTLELTWDRVISDFQQWSGTASSTDQKYFETQNHRGIYVCIKEK